jgi:hypothetical protein
MIFDKPGPTLAAKPLTKTVRIRTVFVHFRTSPAEINYYRLKIIYLGNGMPVENQYAGGVYF